MKYFRERLGMAKHNVGVAGLGVVGGGVVAILTENRDEIARRTGVDITVRTVAEKDAEKARAAGLESAQLADDAMVLLADDEIQTVVEVIGGTTFARDFVMKAIAAGKNVVTANKALMAEYGVEIAAAAKEKGVTIGYEASTGGGIPVIRTLQEAYAGDSIVRIAGILNGTSNYILSRMSLEGVSFDEALADAQAKGYAEADPTLDISGADSAHKITILARLAFGEEFPYAGVHTEGISGISRSDIEYALELGYRVKLLAVAKRREDLVEIHVSPSLVKTSHPLAHVEGVFNSIFIEGRRVGETMLYGQGAGRWPTASAIVGDIIDVATGRAATVARPEPLGRLSLREMAEVQSRYYIRLQAVDRPGVLAKISGVLGERGISIASAFQQERKEGQSVPLVIVTHQALEGAVQDALREISSFDVMTGDSVLLREEE